LEKKLATKNTEDQALSDTKKLTHTIDVILSKSKELGSIRHKERI
jgi:hypothetical protein